MIVVMAADLRFKSESTDVNVVVNRLPSGYRHVPRSSRQSERKRSSITLVGARRGVPRSAGKLSAKNSAHNGPARDSWRWFCRSRR